MEAVERHPSPDKLAEAHGCNATLHSVGNPSFGMGDWIRHVVMTCGGYVGHVRVSGAQGFVAFVPADGDPQGRYPVLPPPGWLPGHFLASMSELLVELSGERPVLEASCSLGGESCDLARGTHTGNSRATAPARMSTETETPASPLAAAMQRRIRSGANSGGFLVSASDSGETLVIVEGDGGPLEVRISGDRAAIEAHGADTPMLHPAGRAIAALAGMTDVRLLAISGNAATAARARIVRD